MRVRGVEAVPEAERCIAAGCGKRAMFQNPPAFAPAPAIDAFWCLEHGPLYAGWAASWWPNNKRPSTAPEPAPVRRQARLL